MKIDNAKHLDPEVDQAITRLCDALCTWERNTGRQSVLIIREQGDFCFRASSGKPNVDSRIDDDDLIFAVLG